MRIFTKATTIAACVGLIAACTSEPRQPAADVEPTPEPTAVAEPVQPAAETADAGAPEGEPGEIKIKVAFEGQKPKAKPLNRKADPYCAKTKRMDETVAFSESGALKNVVVSIADKVKGDFEVPAEAISIHQEECMYSPRVVAGMVGQKVEIKNGDKTLHNVHAYKGMNESNWFNTAQPPNSPVLSKELGNDEIAHLKCDVHPWMTSWISISEHPFNKVVDDEGSVHFTDVPARAKPYKLTAWHEKFGKKEVEVMVEPGKTAEVTITYKADGQG
ncbi:MAG: hypothetical protein R3C68_15740 [Myxococcota bacterium]